MVRALRSRVVGDEEEEVQPVTSRQVARDSDAEVASTPAKRRGKRRQSAASADTKTPTQTPHHKSTTSTRRAASSKRRHRSRADDEPVEAVPVEEENSEGSSDGEVRGNTNKKRANADSNVDDAVGSQGSEQEDDAPPEAVSFSRSKARTLAEQELAEATRELQAEEQRARQQKRRRKSEASNAASKLQKKQTEPEPQTDAITKPSRLPMDLLDDMAGLSSADLKTAAVPKAKGQPAEAQTVFQGKRKTFAEADVDDSDEELDAGPVKVKVLVDDSRRRTKGPDAEALDFLRNRLSASHRRLDGPVAHNPRKLKMAKMFVRRKHR
eukprot:m.132659 g.132659  ORF g.132659 m.132659 type:complete len:325 (-) comp16852_c0_seq3:36-1010(-)